MRDDWGSIRQEAAQVLLAEGIVIDGSLHLLLRLQYPPGPETPIEMLNRIDPFFALTGSSGGVLFVPKAQTAMVTCHHQAPPTDPERLSAAKMIAMDVVVVGGREFRGRAALELPPGRNRALDYVNGPGTFFTLWTDDVTHYVNKLLVRTIRPLD
ncbi:MAG TPA: hypothetical protein VE091_02490 [Gemmatimonadales bacterium]|jgi:hypothetical protein|nr:hypothetical protein [Gemmatimonadales bacterium]